VPEDEPAFPVSSVRFPGQVCFPDETRPLRKHAKEGLFPVRPCVRLFTGRSRPAKAVSAKDEATEAVSRLVSWVVFPEAIPERCPDATCLPDATCRMSTQGRPFVGSSLVFGRNPTKYSKRYAQGQGKQNGKTDVTIFPVFVLVFLVRAAAREKGGCSVWLFRRRRSPARFGLVRRQTANSGEKTLGPNKPLWRVWENTEGIPPSRNRLPSVEDKGQKGKGLPDPARRPARPVRKARDTHPRRSTVQRVFFIDVFLF